MFPELVLTGATCGHLYFQRHLTGAAMDGLKRVAAATQGSDMLLIVGLPLAVRGAVYSAAAAVCGGEVLGFTARANVRGTVFSALPEGEIDDVDLEGRNCCRESEIIYSATDAINGLAVACSSPPTGSSPCRPPRPSAPPEPPLSPS